MKRTKKVDGYEIFRFYVKPEGFDREHSGVGILNGGVDLDIKLRVSPEGYGLEAQEGGMDVEVSVPGTWSIPELLPVTGEMISDRDLWLRNFKSFWNRQRSVVEPKCKTFDAFLNKTFIGTGYGYGLRNEEPKVYSEI
jgi:hypothetical protein